MLRVGLTGSIAVGKSFVSAVLSELGCHVLDADKTARDVVAPGTVGLSAVVKEFGRKVLRADGALDRAQLGRIVFADVKQRERLNAILHPLIHTAQEAWMKAIEEANPHGVAIVDAALMIESGGYRRFDKIIVVHCRPEIQLARLIERNRLAPAEAAQRIAAQMPQAEKLRYADYLIDSSGSFDETRKQTESIYAQLKIAGREK